MTRAEITQSKLNHSNPQDLDKFAKSVLLLLNPKFESQEEGTIAYQILIDFAKTSDLTHEEMLTAIRLAMNKQLFIEEGGKYVPVKMFREVDYIKLAEVQYAYQELKRINHEHQKAKERIIKTLEPPKQISDEEKKQIDIEYFKHLQDELKSGNIDYSAFIFYERLESKINMPNEDKKALYQRELKKYELELKEQADKDFYKRNIYKDFVKSVDKRNYKEVIVNRSKAVAVCEFLKQFAVLPFEEFYKQTK